MSNDAKFWCFIAKDYLKHFGNPNPTLQQFEDMIDLLSKVWLRRDLMLSPKLTEKEKACLYHASMDEGIKETARLLDISTFAIKKRRRTALKKLGYHSMDAAIANGIRYGALPEIPEVPTEQDNQEEAEASEAPQAKEGGAQ